jgi:nucleoid DNA-binding protein
MQIDIATHIEKLLFLHDALTIPGFGAFSARPSPASTDYVGGTVAPPSKSLTFNENITTDDGLLVQDVAKTYGMNTEDARKSVREFVDNMQDLLNRREIVTLRGVGRLYKNYVQKIQFLPDTTNFNPESFGLPPLQFHPIARSREVVTDKSVSEPTAVPPPAPAKTETPVEVAPSAMPVATPAAVVTPPAVPVTVETSVEKRGNEFVPVLVTLLILLVLAAAYWVWKRQKAEPKTENPVVVVEDKAVKNEKPVDIPKSKEPEPEVKEPEVKVEPEKTASQSASEKMNEARNALKGKKDGRECILIVATLQEKNNADRLRGMLRKAGYEVYEVRKGGFQIGVKFYYNNIKEVQDKMLSISKLTGEKQIWIKKK